VSEVFRGYIPVMPLVLALRGVVDFDMGKVAFFDRHTVDRHDFALRARIARATIGSFSLRMFHDASCGAIDVTDAWAHHASLHSSRTKAIPSIAASAIRSARSEFDRPSIDSIHTPRHVARGPQQRDRQVRASPPRLVSRQR
jgi:hypothetical protein